MNTNGYAWEIKKCQQTVGYAYSYEAAYDKAYPLNEECRIADAPQFGRIAIVPLYTEEANAYFSELAKKYMQEEGEDTDYECLVRLGHWIDKGFTPYIDSYKVIWCEDHIVGNCSVDDFGIYTYEDYKDMNCAGFKDLEQYGLEMNREE